MSPDIACPDAEAALLGCLLRLPAGRHLDERALRVTEAVEQSEWDVLAAMVGASR